MASIKECLAFAASLSDVSESPRLDIEVLLAAVLQKDRAYLFTWPEKIVDAKTYTEFLTCLERRKTGEPIAYILGEREFWSLSFFTDSSTLIPRPDTEVLVEQALEVIERRSASLISSDTREAAVAHSNIRVLDLGTGTGAIAIALAHERPDCLVDAVDISPEAVHLAQRNCERHGVKNLRILQSSWFSNVSGRYDLIVSNPPYIDQNDPHLQRGDVRFEPTTALVSDDQGLYDITLIVASARAHLYDEGRLIIEHGWQQASAVRAIFTEYGFDAVGSIKDYGGNERLTFGICHNTEQN